MGRTCAAFVVLVLGTVFWVPPSKADGALAIGIAPQGVLSGFKYAFQVDHSASEARKQALTKCREGNSTAAQACSIVQTFRRQCVAVSMDPAEGTPGVGWAVAKNLAAAESQALAKCEATAGPKRRGECKVDRSGCDGSEKRP